MAKAAAFMMSAVILAFALSLCLQASHSVFIG